MLKISRSYSRKLNHELVGGNKYESSDFFSCWEKEINEKLGYEVDYKAISKELYDNAKADVDLAVAAEIAKIKALKKSDLPF